MARMEIEGKRLKLAEDGTLFLADAEQEMGALGQLMRDPESKKWVARVADEGGKVGRAKSEHPTRQEAFAAILQARGVVKAS